MWRQLSLDHPNRVVPDCSLLSLKCRVPIKDFAAGAIYILIRRESQNELMKTVQSLRRLYTWTGFGAQC